MLVLMKGADTQPVLASDSYELTLFMDIVNPGLSTEEKDHKYQHK